MEYLIDLNSTNRNLNNPIYCTLPKKRDYGDVEKIHRIPGKDDILETDLLIAREEYLKRSTEENIIDAFDHQGMLFCKQIDEEEREFVTTKDFNSIDLKIFSTAPKFCVVFPARYLKSDAATFLDIVSGSNNLPDSFAYKTTQLLQILFFLFSEDGIERTWSGVLPSDKKKKEVKKGKKRGREEGEDEEEEEGANLNENFAETGTETDYVVGRGTGTDAAVEEEDDDAPSPMLKRDPNRIFSEMNSRKGEPGDLQFSIEHSDYEGRKVYDRVLIDLVTVSKSGSQKVHRVNKRTFDKENVLFQEDIECFLFVFTIVDPNVNVMRGIFRSIKANNIILREVTKKKKIKTAASDKVDFRIDDTDSYIWDLRCMNAIDKIFKIENFIDYLAVATSHPLKFKEEFDFSNQKNLWYLHANEFNIVNVLNLYPQPNSWHLWSGMFSYNNLNRVEDGVETLTDSEFLALPDLQWEKNRYRVSYLVEREEEKYEEDENGEGFLEKKNIQKVVYTPHTIHFYPTPNTVIRYSSHHIDAYLFGSTLLPCYMNSERQGVVLRTEGKVLFSRNRRFPTLSQTQASQIQLALKFLKDKLMNKQALSSRVIYCSADTVRSDVYKVAKGEKDHTINVSSKTELHDKMLTAYDLVTRTLKGDSPNLSPSMAAIVKFVENEQAVDEKFSIFPDLYSPEVGFEFYQSYGMLSNAIININHTFLDLAEALRHSHTNMWRLIFLSGYAGFLRPGFQPTVAIFGDYGSGKSTIFKIIQNYSVPGLVKRVDSSTKQASNTITSSAGMINLMDESDANAPFVAKTGNEMDVDGEWKTKRTEGAATREVQEKSITEKRITVAIEADARTFDIWGGNLRFRDLPGSARDRVDVQMLINSFRILSVNKLKYIRMSYKDEVISRHKRNFIKLLRGFQIFTYNIGYLSRAGAIAYNQTHAIAIIDSMNERAKTALDGVLTLRTDKTYNSRFESDRLPILVECIMLFRIYIAICSGLVPFVKPNEPFSVEKIKEIADSGILLANEDDYVMALSFYDQLFSFTELRAFIVFCKRKFEYLKLKTGVISYRSDLHPSVWPKEPFFVARNDYPDYNELNLERILNVPSFDNMKDEEVLKHFAEQVGKEFPDINRDLLKEQLLQLSSTTVEYDEYISSVEQSGDSTARGATKTGAVKQSFILTPVKIEYKNKCLTSFTLKRQWLDDMIKNEFGPIHNQASYTNAGFMGGALETALQFCNYKDMFERKIVLPGMTLNRVRPGNPGDVRELPHIFKTMHFGKYIANEADIKKTIEYFSGFSENFNHFAKEKKKKEVEQNKPISIEDYTKLKIPVSFHYLGDGGKRVEVSNPSPGNPKTDPTAYFFARNLNYLEQIKLGEKYNKTEFVKSLNSDSGPVATISPVALEKEFKKKFEKTVKKEYYSTFMDMEKKYGSENGAVADEQKTINFDNMFS